jgi:hypothetical protein
MAKRKAAGAKTKARKAGRARPAKTASRARMVRKTGKASAGARKTSSRKTAGRKTAARASAKAPASSRGSAKREAGRKTTARKVSRARAATPALRKAPALDRARRTIQGDDIVPTPPSSLDLDRNASAARSGRRHVRDRLKEHHETSPALTAGDVDADWESAASVGDEAPGGDNPTPDQDIVDDIGKAVGVQYEDNEELKGEEKITKRDKHRWELDPASAEDYDERKR